MSVEKQEADYTVQVDAALPAAVALAQSGLLAEAIEGLLPLEKKARMACDLASTTRLLQAIVELCFDAQNWDMLSEQLIALAKRRGQLKQAMTKMVQSVMAMLDKTPSKEVLIKLIDTIRVITAGKIHVENERARVTLRLSKIKEEEGNLNEAAEVLHELQVETFGSMERREKVEIILEQMRLALAKHDYIRTQILSKKISTRYFKEPNTEDLKLAFYRYSLEVAEHEANYIDMCLHHQAILDTPSILNDESSRMQALRDVVIYVVLSKHDNTQADLLNKISKDKHLSASPVFHSLITQFLTNEVMVWSDVEAQYGHVLRATPAFLTGSDSGNRKWSHLRTRVIEHNIRVIAKYYTKMTTKRLIELLALGEDECEEVITNLVVSGTVYAKIDRLTGVVCFTKPTSADAVLANWASGSVELMRVVDKATHLIHKERMVHKV